MNFKKLFFVFLLAFFLRLFFLNQSLWLDEAITANVVKKFSYLSIIQKFSPFDFHPPLYYLFMKFWSNIFGYSEVSLRFPSIIFSLLSGFFVYKIAQFFKKKKIIFWSVVFFLFNPLIIYYSQEVRMYMMVNFFVIVSFYFFIKLQKNLQTQKLVFENNFLLMNLFLILSFFTFYGSIFFILAILFYFLFKKQYQYLILSTCYFLLSFLIISPLLYQQWVNSKISLAEVKNWSLVLGKANFKNLLLIPIKFSVGRISFYPKLVYWLITGFFTIFVFFNIFKNLNIKNSLEIKNLKFILFYFFIFPLFLGFVISFFIPLLQYFRFIYLIPLMSLLSVDENEKTNEINVVLAIGFLFWSVLYLFFPMFHREDWKSLSYYLKSNKINQVYMIPSSSDGLRYYYSQIKIKPLQDLCQHLVIPEKPGEKIYLIPYTSSVWGLDYQQCIKNNPLFFEKTIKFRQLLLEVYRVI